jgi:hypothetical protein
MAVERIEAGWIGYSFRPVCSLYSSGKEPLQASLSLRFSRFPTDYKNIELTVPDIRK